MIPASAIEAAVRKVLDLHAPIEDRGWVSGGPNNYLWCASCGSLDDSPEPYPCETVRTLSPLLAELARG